DPLDLSGHQQIDRSGNREIGLAGSGGAQPKDQFVLAQRLDVCSLPNSARSDPALAGTEGGVVLPQAETAVGNLGLRQTQCRFDDRQIDILALLQPVVK